MVEAEARTVNGGKSEKAPSAQQLTEHQIAIMKLVAGGVPQRLIAKRLKISLRTVEVHARRIRKRLGATTMTQAVVIAIQRMLISIDSAPGK
jgi:two-component system nitrate/nitrite response regulator NarL